MKQIQINVTKFKLGLLISFAITILYPIGLFISMPIDDAVTILRHDLSWSLFAIFFIPVGFGLMCSVISTDILSKVDYTMKILLTILFSIGTVAIFIAVLDDAKGVPNPDRISTKLHSNINYQEKALQIDKCLRGSNDCQDDFVDTSFESIKSCIDKAPVDSFEKEIVLEIKNSKTESESKNFSSFQKRLSYECLLNEIANKNGHTEIPSSIMKYIAIALNFIIVFYFWSFIWVSGVYFSYGRKEVGKPTIHVLLGSFIILITWFPLRLYAVWHQWYYTIYQLKFYDAFWALLVFTVILLMLYLIWSISVNLNVSMFIAIPTVHSALAVIFGVLVSIEPAILEYAFKIYGGLDWSILLVILCGVLFFITTYAKSLIEQE